MKKTLGIGAGVGVLGLLLWMGTALGFSAVSADAGYFGNLTVLGSCTGPGCGGGGGSGVIADAGNFIAVSVDAGPIVIYSPQTDLGPCAYGNPNACNGSYTYIDRGIYMHNNGGSIAMCGNSPASPWDGGLCFQIYQNAGGFIEFNAVGQDNFAPETTCQMDVLNGDFSCLHIISSNGISANELQVLPNPFSITDPAVYEFAAGPDPTGLDAGGTELSALFVQNTNPYLRSMYFSDSNFATNSGWILQDFREVLRWSGIPPITGLLIVDAGIIGAAQAGTLTVTNSAVIQSLTTEGGINSDGGVQFGQGPNFGCVGQMNANPTLTALGWGACVNGSGPNQNQSFIYSDGTTKVAIGSSAINLPTNIWGNDTEIAVFGNYGGSTALDVLTNLAVGSSGSKLSNIGVGTCTLSSGECNAVVGGATGNSLCYCGIQGTYARDAGTMTCYAQADAGSASCYCQTAALAPDPAPAPVGIHCDN